MNTETATKTYPSLLGGATVPMNREQTQLFMNCSIQEEITKGGSPFTDDIAKKLGPIGQILYSRIRLADVRITLELAVWCSTLSEGVPGNLVLWAWTLRELSMLYAGRELTIADWTNHFPMGVPTPEEYHRVWRAQKVSGIPDNALDKPAIWKTV